MIINEKIDFDYLALSELTKEIGSIVENSFSCGNNDLTPMDIEHILKITCDVTYRIKSQMLELTV